MPVMIALKQICLVFEIGYAVGSADCRTDQGPVVRIHCRWQSFLVRILGAEERAAPLF